jgi:hypothetical protein
MNKTRKEDTQGHATSRNCVSRRRDASSLKPRKVLIRLRLVRLRKRGFDETRFRSHARRHSDPLSQVSCIRLVSGRGVGRGMQEARGSSLVITQIFALVGAFFGRIAT